MLESNKSAGSCLCGDVEIDVINVNPNFTVCHCATCRNWGGGPLFALQCGTEVKFKGADKVKEYDSSDWASRGFCSTCGTHLFYRLKKTGSYNMPVGLFSKIKDLVMTTQYFSDLRPDYYCFSNQTQEMTEAEIKSYFASQV